MGRRGSYNPMAQPAYGQPYQDPFARSNGQPRKPAQRRRSRKRGGMEWAWVVVAIALIGVTIVASVGLFAVLRGERATADTAEGMTAAEATAVVIVPTAVPNLELYTGSDGPGAEPTQADASMGYGIGIEPWSGNERFTILAMGWDRRPTDPADAAYRTDTMMLISIDPATATIGVLSIPRDLYVVVPGYSQLQRINSAYVLGELRQPGYGPDLTMQTVQYNLGMRVHDYIIVDFNTFTTVIDAIGGIDIDNPSTINDPQYPNMYYGYDPFYLPAGVHHLDGATALKYARTRHGNSDFDRAERQQQVIRAVRDQIVNFGNLPQLIVSAPTIWASVREGLRTGLDFEQVLQLGWYVKDIPMTSVRMGVIDERYTYFYTTPRGESVVVPDRNLIGPLMLEIFGPTYNQ